MRNVYLLTLSVQNGFDPNNRRLEVVEINGDAATVANLYASLPTSGPLIRDEMRAMGKDGCFFVTGYSECSHTHVQSLAR